MKNRGFSLIELLVVMAIITLVIGLLVPAFSSIGRAQALTSGGSAIIDSLTSARQTALAQNRVVEVRFYKRRENPGYPADPVANAEKFRSFRSVIYDDQVRHYRPLTAIQNLPAGVIIAEEAEFSSLLHPYTDTVPSRKLDKESLPGGEGEVEFQCIRFRPTGGTDLPPAGTPDNDKWFLTVKYESDPVVEGKPARNYVTAMLEPVSGRVRTFRP